MQNPHDRIFKKILGANQNAADFLQNYLPPDILTSLDLDSLRTEDRSFIDESLQESYSDLLYSANVKDDCGDPHNCYIYLLMEHKSNPDRFTALQLLHYMTLIWKQQMNVSSEGLSSPSRLRMILPLLLYHGESHWQFGFNFVSLLDIPTESLRKYTVNFEYLLWDLSSIPDHEIKGRILIKTFLLVLKYVRNSAFREKLPEVLNLMAALYHSEKSGLEDLRALLLYIFRAADNIDSREALDFIEATPLVKESIMPTIADLLSSEARLEGKLEGKLDDARKMLEEHLPVDLILRVTGLTTNDLKRAGLLKKE